jgi:UDP-N-acetylmuramoyl-L-alanyl-D-glutamate--2,6-diaminopimelate ligase
MVVACGVPKEKALHDIAKLRSIQGRMEQAADGIYVDYAHTPDALENALKSLRPHTEGKLFVVFGCGGDRDKGKRPQMGKIADDLADVVIVTDDNPRTENASVIRSEILIDCPKAVEIADRKKAIIRAVSDMKKGDVLLIAGKGHEKYQIIGTEKLHFDDVETIKEARGKL